MDIRFKVYCLDRWTKQAVDCYKRGCICDGCFIYETYMKERHCFMKNTVLELVKKFGRPL